jgi:hypothetical protein
MRCMPEKFRESFYEVEASHVLLPICIRFDQQSQSFHLSPYRLV